MRRISQLPANLDRAKRMALFKAGWEMHEKAVGWAPHKTGDLRRSVTVAPPSISAIKDRVTVGTNKIYGRIHDRGGTIRPKNKKFLAWQNPKGQWHFAKQVKIPKYKGRGYLTPSFRRMVSGRFQTIMKAEISAVFRKI